MTKSAQISPFLVFSRNSSGQQHFRASLRNRVGRVGFSAPFQAPQSVANLNEPFGTSSNTYPTSIQHKIPHLARALGNTRYVMITEDPTLLYPWKGSNSSGQWNSYPADDNDNTNSINYDLSGVYPYGDRETTHHQKKTQIEAFSHPYKLEHLPAQKSPHRHRLSHRQIFYHDRGRNGHRQLHGPNLPVDYRLPHPQAPLPPGYRSSLQKGIYHFHCRSRKQEHRQVPLTQRPLSGPGASPEQQPPARSPRDSDKWSPNLRYGNKNEQKRVHGCSSQRTQHEQKSQMLNRFQDRSSQGFQNQASASNTKRLTRNYENELRPSHNDLPVLGTRWSNQPYRKQESRTVPNVRFIHDRPERELTKQSFPAPYLGDPIGHKVVKNLTTIIKEEFDKSPHIYVKTHTDEQNPYLQSEYRYTGFPNFDYDGWFSPRQTGPPSASTQLSNGGSFLRELPSDRANRSAQYMRHKNQETSQDDTEEILSDDNDADVGIVAIGQKAIRRGGEQLRVDTDKKNSSQDFLGEGELRFPDQNAGELRELIHLLKDIPENKTIVKHNYSDTCGHLVGSTQNIEFTGDMFIGGKDEEPSLRQRQAYTPQSTISETKQRFDSWDPLTKRLSTITSPTNGPKTLQSRQEKVQQIRASVNRTADYKSQIVSNKLVPNIFKLAHGIQHNDQRQQFIYITPQPQYHFSVSRIRQMYAPKFTSRNHQPTGYHATTMPRYSNEEQRPLNKRVRKIQAPTTIELLPVASFLNKTKLKTANYVSSSSKENNFSSKEHESFCPDYYQDNQVQYANTTLSFTNYQEVNPDDPTPTTENTEPATATSEVPGTTATERAIVLSKKWRQLPVVRNHTGKVIHQHITRKPITSTPVQNDISLKLLRKDALRVLRLRRPCDDNECSSKNDSKPINIKSRTSREKDVPTKTDVLVTAPSAVPQLVRNLMPRKPTSLMTPTRSVTKSVTEMARKRRKAHLAPTNTNGKNSSIICGIIRSLHFIRYAV